MTLTTELASAPPHDERGQEQDQRDGCPYKRAQLVAAPRLQPCSIWPSVTARAVGPTSLADVMKGATVAGDSGHSPTQLPAWLDMARCLKVNQFWQKHTFNLTMSWHFSLVIGFCLPRLLSALVFTGESDTPSKSIKRYMRTAAALAYWHTGNIWDPSAQAFKSVQGVRGLHAGVREAMGKALPDTMWLSMADMSIVQSGFMGASSLFPKKLGIHAPKQDLDDYIYFWRCVGYQLGIGDEYNLCSLGNPVADNIVEEVMNQLVIPDIAHPPAEYHPIAQAYIDGLNLLTLRIPVFTIPSSLAVSFWGLDRPIPPLSCLDTLRYWALRVMLFVMGYLPLYGRLMSWATRSSFRQFSRMVPPATPQGVSVGSCPFAGVMAMRGALPAHVIAGAPNTPHAALLAGCPHAARAVRTVDHERSTIPTLTPLGVAVLGSFLAMFLFVCAVIYFVIHALVPHLISAGPEMWWGALRGVYDILRRIFDDRDAESFAASGTQLP